MAILRPAALLVASLLVVVAIADGRRLTVAHQRFNFHGANVVVKGVKGASDSALVCTRAHGVEAGETCDSIVRRFGAEMGPVPVLRFVLLNPNINCQALFVGQWVCLQGKLVAA